MKYKKYNLQDVYDAEKQNKFNVISTFAGGGGSSTGYRLAGGKILCINEFVQEARNTYTENYPSTPILPNDIKELTGQELLDAGHVKVGEVDILDGSPPLWLVQLFKVVVTQRVLVKLKIILMVKR
jgi:DNA (cytosine-5)-methyltransferase 1